MLEKIKEDVCKANIDLKKHGLLIFTWGNASAIDRSRGLLVIKPSGIDYDTMKPVDMVVCDMKGNVIEGKLKPSSDMPTHLYLYKNFKEIGGIVHTHSTYATSWAQAGKGIPNIGTTHADYFAGEIPCTRQMAEDEIVENYEKNTGKVIVEHFNDINPVQIPGVLVNNHGPFSWGKDVFEAVHNTVVMEQVAKMAAISFSINPNLKMNPHLIKKHYERKHGKNAYYGQ